MASKTVEETVPMNQFRFEIHGHMTHDGYEQSTDYRCNYCNKLCYYGERFSHTCEAYQTFLIQRAKARVFYGITETEEEGKR